MPPFAGDLLALSRQLLGAQAPDQVLEHVCRALQRLAGVDLLFVSVGQSANWATGLHLRFQASGRDCAGSAERSALFAVHRAVSRYREPVTLAAPAYATVVDSLSGKDGQTSEVLAVPIIHRKGRLSGCLALCARTPLGDDVRAVVTEVAELAALALESVQRLAVARRYRERLSLLAEAAEEALWDWAPDTGEFWWGGGVQSLLGDVVVQSRLSWKFEQIHPDDSDRVRLSFDRALTTADAETWREEYRQRRTDGSWILVEDHARILRDSTGRVHRVVGALRDVTELRGLLAREQAARAEAERASLAKDEFLAMLGHELRNPLSPILTALQLMQLRGVEGAARERAIIERQVRHVVRLVEDLLDVSRITRGAIELKRDRVRLADIVAKAIEQASPLIEQRLHRLEVDIPADVFVDADPVRLAQVVSNLLTNAAKYTDSGGQIQVRAARQDADVVVRVIDDGIGIAPEMLPRVFEAFAQERQRSDRTLGGLGLGLAIVKSLVEAHGGTVRLGSEGIGRGTQVSVRLPVATVASDVAPSPRAATRAAAAAPGCRVLLVDDNEDAVTLLADSLAGLGHAVRVAVDAPTALALARQYVPDVAMLDVGLPVIDGHELAQRLRAVPGWQDVRFAALTGYGQQHDRHRSRAAGFDVHLVKPIDLREVDAALRGLWCGKTTTVPGVE